MMRPAHRVLITTLLTLCSIILIGAATCYYFLNTLSGTQTLINYAILKAAPYGSIQVESSAGTIANGLSLKNVELKNWPIFTTGAILRIQRVDLDFDFFDWRKIKGHVFNGRLFLPDCDAMVFNGTYMDGAIQGSAHGRALDVAVIMKPFLPMAIWKYLSGSISDAQLDFQGPLGQPRITGRFYVDRIEYGNTKVREGLARFDLAFVKDKGEWRTNGRVILESGLVNVQRNTIELQQSKAVFLGNLLDPSLAIYGSAKAGEYSIDLRVTGTLLKPKVFVYSAPFLSEDMALMALGLGNWMPSYFSSPYDTGNQRLGMKKKISKDIGVGFALEQAPTLTGEHVEYSKMLEGELSLSDTISFNVAEIIAPDSETQAVSSVQNEKRSQGGSLLYLKYKNTF